MEIYVKPTYIDSESDSEYDENTKELNFNLTWNCTDWINNSTLII